MLAVIFEVELAPGGEAGYLDAAARLKPMLEQIDGFISIERFSSLATPGKLLSLSYWRDEQAVRAWREMEQHRAAQAQGREGLFADYRIRVANVVRDYGMREREQAPHRSVIPAFAGMTTDAVEDFNTWPGTAPIKMPFSLN